MPEIVVAVFTRLAVGGGLVACVVAASSASASTKGVRTYSTSCARSTAQWPPGKPALRGALTVGPVHFGRWGPARRKRALRPPTVLLPQPNKHDVLYHVVSFFDISTAARRGVTISVIGKLGKVALLFDGYAHWVQTVSGHRPLAAAPRSVRFPLCHAPQSGRPEVTQYGITVALRKPGCFRVQVQPTGQRRRYVAKIRVLVPHC